MKTKIESIILKVLLLIFAVGTLFVGIFLLPSLADEMVILYPQLINVKNITLIISESLLVLLLIGILIIIYLLRKFDKSLTFSNKFLKGLEALVILCILAFIGVISIYIYTSTFAVFHPLTTLLMSALAIFILILATVIMLIRAIVKNAITYKTDYDLTV